MVMGVCRWLRSLIGAVLVLAAGVALFEVGLRVHRMQYAATATVATLAGGETCPLTVPSWQLGWELRPAAKAHITNSAGVKIKLTTNSLGFRSDEIAVPKPPGIYRIVCLGDETLLAPETPIESTFCHHLQELLQARTQIPVEVINAAVPHGCPVTEWLVYRHRALSVQADLVLVHAGFSDLADDRDLRRFTNCDRHGVPVCCSHPLLSKKACVNIGDWRNQFCVVDWGYQQVWKQVEETAPVRRGPSIWSNVEALSDSNEFVQMLEPLKHLSKSCDASYCRCVAWTTPSPWQLSGTATAEGTARQDAGVPKKGLVSSRAPFEAMSRTLTEWKIACLDASSAFPSGSEADPLFLADEPRWTEAGHERVAQFVAEQIVQHLPGPWSSPYFRSNAVPANYTERAAPARQ